jgi:hypothetical protein
VVVEMGTTTIFQLYRGAQFYSWRTPEYSGKTINLSFLLHVTDGRMRVWRHKDTAYTPRNIQPTPNSIFLKQTNKINSKIKKKRLNPLKQS